MGIYKGRDTSRKRNKIIMTFLLSMMMIMNKLINQSRLSRSTSPGYRKYKPISIWNRLEILVKWWNNFSNSGYYHKNHKIRTRVVNQFSYKIRNVVGFPIKEKNACPRAVYVCYFRRWLLLVYNVYLILVMVLQIITTIGILLFWRWELVIGGYWWLLASYPRDD